MVMVLTSAYVWRFSISRMQDLCFFFLLIAPPSPLSISFTFSFSYSCSYFCSCSPLPAFRKSAGSRSSLAGDLLPNSWREGLRDRELEK